jgi:hypothetical protein
MARPVTACGSCGAAIRWAVTVNGKRIPVDDAPVRDGNLVLSDPTPGAYAPLAAHYSPPDEPLLPGFDEPPRFVSHFATCPNADRHRRRTHP